MPPEPMRRQETMEDRSQMAERAVTTAAASLRPEMIAEP
jgi:hypothetical protein